MRLRFTSFLVMLCATGAVAFGTSQTSPAQNATASAGPTVGGFQQRNARYRLHRGDTVAIDFAYTSEMNQSVTIQPDGFVSLRQVAPIRIEGLTLDQATSAIQVAYKHVLKDPEISVTPVDLDKPFFVVSGQVGKPGKYDLRSELTVSEGIAIAGGLNETSKHSDVVLFRRISPDTFETKVLNIKHILASRNLNEDAELQPGDVIYVPKNMTSKIMRFVPAQNVGMYASPTSF